MGRFIFLPLPTVRRFYKTQCSSNTCMHTIVYRNSLDHERSSFFVHKCHTLQSLPSMPHPGTSCNIHKPVHIVVVPPQILLFHQSNDPLLDHVHLGHKVILDRIDRLRLERLVRELLFGFHDPHDRGVEVVFAVRVDVRLRALRFLGL